MPLDLQAIKERVDDLDTENWSFEISEYSHHPNLIKTDDGDVIGETYYEYEAVFIAHARQDVPALIAEVERLNELIVKERKEHLLKVFEVIGDADKKLAEENEQLRKALGFYANHRTYMRKMQGMFESRPSDIEEDEGQIARKLLEGEK